MQNAKQFQRLRNMKFESVVDERGRGWGLDIGNTM